MKLALIGAQMHWHTYEPSLKTIPDVKLVGVAPGSPDETLGAFDHAPGLSVETRRYSDAKEMLEREKPDVAQVCARPDWVARLSQLCLERGVPVVAEKPMAIDLRELEKLYAAAMTTKVSIVPMHTMRGEPILAAIAQTIHENKIGRPQLAFSQKSYKWGKNRPDYFKRRTTFPGLAPFIGIHALDWLHWMLGDVFTEVVGNEGAPFTGYPACPSNASYSLRMKNGGTAALTLDYMRPDKAPTHGDERVRIVGSTGVVEAALEENRTSLITMDESPRPLALSPQPDIFTAFVRSLRREAPPLMSITDAFRITEIAFKAGQAAETGKRVSLAESSFR